MLTLTRKPGQALILDDGEIVVRVRRVTPSRVELVIDAPREMPVLRGEVADGFQVTISHERQTA